MRIGIGLPNTIDIPGPDVAAWAGRAEERGFACVATIDRLVYPSYDSLTSLAVAAGATSRIGLLTDILLAPAYQPAWLAKATASLAAMSGGRLTLGVGVGGRPDDYAAAGRPFERRGELMDQTLELITSVWQGRPLAEGEHPIGPTPAGGRVPMLIGGNADAAVRRTVRYGDGWTAGGGTPEMSGQMAARVRAAWEQAGREGEPRLGALAYYGLGDDEASATSLRRYYGFLGDYAEVIAGSAVRSAEQARGTVQAFADAGITELTFFPSVASLDQVDRLADAVM